MDRDIMLIHNIGAICDDTVAPDGFLFVVYCEQGTMTVEKDCRSYTFGENGLFFCLPSERCEKYVPASDFRGAILCVRERLCERVVEHCFLLQPDWWEKKQYLRNHPVIPVTPERKKLLVAYASLIGFYVSEPARTFPAAQVMENLGCALAAELMEMIPIPCYSIKREEEAIHPLGRKDRNLMEFFRLVECNAAIHRDVGWYADRLCLTPKYLSDIVKSKTGQSAHKIIAGYTLAHIRNYLLHSGLSVKEIASEMQFSSSSSFCLFVRNCTGMSPLEFKENYSRFGLPETGEGLTV